MRPLRFVKDLTEESRSSLEEIYRHSASFALRQRAHAILLSAQGFTLSQLQEILGVHRDTVSTWITRFEQLGTDGLHDGPRTGRPRIYTDEEIQQLQRFIGEEPRQIKQAQARLEQATGKSSSTDTLQRALKKTGTHGVGVVAP